MCHRHDLTTGEHSVTATAGLNQPLQRELFGELGAVALLVIFLAAAVHNTWHCIIAQLSLSLWIKGNATLFVRGT